MKPILRVLVVLVPLVALVCYFRFTQVDRTVEPAALQAIVQTALRSWKVPGLAIAIVQDDKVVFLEGFGLRNLDSTEPVTADTLFPIASCTKAFTTAAMAMLIDEGKMGWDDPVRSHVDFFHLADPHADSLVTLRDLATHRTGLASNDFLWYRSPWDRDEIIRRVGRVKLAYPFRDSFHYQSTMFSAAGCAIEHASGLAWEEYVRQRIFDPLGMTHSVFTTKDALRAADHASPHRTDLRGTVRTIPWYPIEKPDASGSIVTSARDLSAWMRWQLGDGRFEGQRLVSAANLHEMHAPQNHIPLEGEIAAMNPETQKMDYGLGWVVQEYRGRTLIAHAGVIDGFRALVTLVPEAKLGIVLLANLDRTEMTTALANTLVDRFLNLPAKDWNEVLHAQVERKTAQVGEHFRAWQTKRTPGTKTTRELEAYTGTYEHPAYGTALVTFETGILVWKWSSFTIRLLHYDFDTFTAESDVLAYPQVVFHLDSAGEVASMKVADPLGVEFRKVIHPPNEKR